MNMKGRDVATVVLASKNPTKMRAVLAGFQRMFPKEAFELKAIALESGVSDQPRSSEETLRGATIRARKAMGEVPQADYWVGIEGGIEDGGEGMQAFAWVVVRSKSLVGKARSGTFYLPQRVAELIRSGMELGEADDIVFGRENSKENEGAIGILTGGVIDRAGLYEHAVVLALVPFKNATLYSGDMRDWAGD